MLFSAKAAGTYPSNGGVVSLHFIDLTLGSSCLKLYIGRS